MSTCFFTFLFHSIKSYILGESSESSLIEVPTEIVMKDGSVIPFSSKYVYLKQDEKKLEFFLKKEYPLPVFMFSNRSNSLIGLSNKSFFNRGEIVIAIHNEGDRCSQNQILDSIETPIDGYVVFANSGRVKLHRDDLLFSVYQDEIDFIKALYPNRISEDIDPFSQLPIMEGSCHDGFDFFSFGVESRLGTLNMIFRYDKALKITQKMNLQFLLENGEVLTFPIVSSPTKNLDEESFKYTLAIEISEQDLVSMSNSGLVLWRFVDTNGQSVIQREYPIVSGLDDPNLKVENLRKILSDFMSEYHNSYLEFKLKNNIEENVQSISKDNKCYVYLMVDTTNCYHKIGISNNPTYREHTLQSEKPTIELLCSKCYPTRAIAEAIESALHETFSSKRIRGEWFALSQGDINSIKETLS